MAGAITKSASDSTATPDRCAPWIRERTTSRSPRFSAVNNCRESFFVSRAPVRLGRELERAQIEAREITLPDEAQDVGHQEFSVPPGRLVGGQDPVVHPALDGRDADAEGPGDVGRAEISGFLHTFRLCRMMADSDVTIPMICTPRGRFNRDPAKRPSSHTA